MEMLEFFEEDIAKGNIEQLENDYGKSGMHSLWRCVPEILEEVALFIWHGPSYFLEMVTAIDQIETDEIIGVYSFNRFDKPDRIVIHVPVPRNNPRLPSIGMIFSGAVWFEREAAEFFGITYTDSMDSRRLLLSDDDEDGYHPLRKDFEQGMA